MLFDLRGRGRRRTVRIVYTGLALLLGVGLVGFGVGGGFGGGGLLNAASNSEGSNSASFSSQIKKYQKLTQTQPGNAAAWEKLTAAQLHEAGGEAYISGGQLTSKGRELFTQTAHSWNRYLALNPPKPNPELAQEMVRVFGQEGLNEPAEAVRVMQIVVAARPTSTALFAALAQYAYQAHNTRAGDLAAQKAVSLAPAAQRARLKLELAQTKKNPTGSGESYTATTNGKTYVGTLGTNKSFTATSSTSTTGPAGQPSKKK
jgi:hypothetical protein